jgi:crossover junction endodeoxyribonuclease RuvC
MNAIRHGAAPPAECVSDADEAWIEAIILGLDLTATLAAKIMQLRPGVDVVEHVAARPKQGVASAFKFGCGFGIVRGVLAATGVPLHLVSARRWKAHFHLDADKERARALALRLWPSRSHLFGWKRDHGRAEAGLLARYYSETQERGQ